ncbi:MAG: cellulase family glycosylhydrolase [Deltaproteobacteria bacterium]|nr:cellulase family glycosylhydrolase [Deltaproteobacteria bacterium]MBN2670139.1 cellulase family glycosylhydrolase [Deltaproteobacteria bacterium]
MQRMMIVVACGLLVLLGSLITGCGEKLEKSLYEQDTITGTGDETDSDSGNDSDSDSQTDEPYVGEGVVLPALIEAEHFVAANEFNQDWDEQDDSCTNALSPGTDILEAPEGGCLIGYTQPGEWFEYIVYVPEAASYDVDFFVGSGVGAILSVSVDGVERDTVTVLETDWDNLEELTMEGLLLSQGEHILRVTMKAGAANFDWFRMDNVGECISACGPRNCGEDECGNACGTCNDDDICSEEQICLDDAACAATCGDKVCGLNVCGDSCGTCDNDDICTPTGYCWHPQGTPVALHGQISVSGNKLLDKNGEVLQLKGVSTQWLNWEQKYSTSTAALQWMRDNWALELLRVANGVENDNGYLVDPVERMAMVKQIIEGAIESGVYVIVDWHTHEGLDHIEEAKAFFTEIAQAYGDEPNIIYEVFNEPLQLDWSLELAPYHEEVIAAIRAYDENNLIIVGTPRWDQRPDEVVDAPIDDPAIAYALHFYACSHDADIRDNGQEALDANLPVFVSEWGATHADGGTASNPGVCEESAREWHSWMQANDISWAAWKMSTDGDDSAFLSSSASVNGGWGEDDIKGHGYLIHEFLMDEQ